MNDREFTSLTDRLVAGERLSAEEMERLEAAAGLDPAAARELELLEELDAFVDGHPDEPSSESIAIAHAALARVAADAARPVTPPLASRSPRHRFVAVGSLAAAAIAVIALSWPRTPASDEPATPLAGAEVTIATGDVTIDGRPVGDAVHSLASSSTIAVRDGRACLAIEPRIDVCLDGTTTARVDGLDAPQTSVVVLHGHAVARLDPLPAGRSFALASTELRAVAVGTIFSIDVADDGATITTAVLDGIVEVQAGEDTIRLAPHEVARLREGRLERERLLPAAEARDLDLLATVPALDGEIGYVAIDVSPARAAVFVDDRMLGKSPLVTALPVGEHRIELRGPDGARLGETIGVHAGTMVARHFSLASTPTPVEPTIVAPTIVAPEPSEPAIEIDEAVTPEPRPRTIVSSPSALLAEARSLRREDRWREAASAYRRLLRDHPRSSEAHTALVSLGDILLDRLGDPGEAARAYVRYLREGAGALAPEARWGIIRARRQQGDARRERAAIEDFLAHHPDDARAASLR